jgi:hypothetical protein
LIGKQCVCLEFGGLERSPSLWRSMVESQQVRQAVTGEHDHFSLERMALFKRLAFGGVQTDDDVTQMGWYERIARFPGRKREHIGRGILAPMLEFQGLQVLVIGDHDANLAFEFSGSHHVQDHVTQAGSQPSWGWSLEDQIQLRTFGLHTISLTRLA